MKRLLPLLLIFALLSPAVAAEAPGRFSDVPDGSWYADAANLCAETGIMVGTGEGKFSPETTLTGPECAVLALRLHSLLHGGDGTFEKAPEDWGKITLTLADGTELTSYGKNAAPLPGLEGRSFSFGWWTWGMMGHVSADNFEVILNLDPALEWNSPAFQAAQEAAHDWGKAHEGAATATVGDVTIPGKVNCWIPTATWVLAFHPDDDEDHAKREVLRAALNANAPVLDAWWRDAAYYCDRQELELNFYSEGEPATRMIFARHLACAVGELPSLRQVDNLPDLERDQYSEDVYMLYEAGILTGTDDCGTFNAGATLTRAEAAAMVARVLDKEQRVDTPLASLPE